MKFLPSAALHSLALYLSRGAASPPFLHPHAHHIPLVVEAPSNTSAAQNVNAPADVAAEAPATPSATRKHVVPTTATAAPQAAVPLASDNRVAAEAVAPIAAAVPPPAASDNSVALEAAVPAADEFGAEGETEVSTAAETAQQLPPVSTMMDTAAETLKSINSQASILEARIAQAQMEREAKMSRQKAIFERRLQQQDRSNQDVILGNKHLSEEIETLKAGNEAVKKHSKELQETNHAMHLELRTIQAKLRLAGSFITVSLKATNDKNAKPLAVLQDGLQKGAQSSTNGDDDTEEGDDASSATVAAPVASPPSAKDDDEEDDDSDPKGTSLLAVAATTRRATATKSSEGAELGQMSDIEAELSSFNLGGSTPQSLANPSDLLNVLSSSVTQLKEQERAGETKLKEMFLTSFKVGTKRHRELIQEQTKLNSTRDSLRVMQTKLKEAEAHLEGTRSDVEQRLRGVGLFLQKLSHVALAPAREAPRLLDTLPSVVSAQQADPVALASA